jgi:hypothetical protein
VQNVASALIAGEIIPAGPIALNVLKKAKDADSASFAALKRTARVPRQLKLLRD